MSVELGVSVPPADLFGKRRRKESDLAPGSFPLMVDLRTPLHRPASSGVSSAKDAFTLLYP